MGVPILLKLCKFFLIFEKIFDFAILSNFWNIKISYIILKHMTWRFQIYNLFREIFNFNDLTKVFLNFAKLLFIIVYIINFNISRTNYRIGISRLQASKWYIICLYF